MKSALLGILVGVAHSTAQFEMPVFSDMRSGHFDLGDVTHVYAHHGHDHSHDHSAPHHPTHEADDDAAPHQHNYVPIRIIRDCVGDFGPEKNKCVCSASEIGFAQNTCEAGQACYSDGGCRDMQSVECKVDQDVGGSTRIRAYYNVDEDGEPIEVLADADSKAFGFEDAGPSASFSVTVQFEGGSPNPNGIMSCADAAMRVRCTAASGPYRSIDTGLRMGELWGNELAVEFSDCEEGSQTSIGSVTGSIRIQPYVPASQESCARASSEELCNSMRAIGARCCYNYEADRCTYDEQCYYASGPVAVTPRDFSKEIFGDYVVSVADPNSAHGDHDHNDNDGHSGSNDDGPLLGLARSLANLIN